MAHNLYADDFYLWTQDQADALRARESGSNRLDYDRLAEEVSDLGASERNKCLSLTFHIIEHFYKLETSRNPEPKNHWRGEIRNWRVDFGFVVTRSIRRLIEDDLDKLHARAARLVQSNMDDYEPGVVVDQTRRWTLPEILGEQDDPLDLAAFHPRATKAVPPPPACPPSRRGRGGAGG